jgi:hypothetical protein
MEDATLSAATPPDESQNSLALERTFPTVTLDEKDLATLTEIASELPKHYGGHIDIEVTSADRQETVKATTSHAFFLTPDMPRVICCVHISYYNLNPSVSLQLRIGSQFILSDAVNLNADGVDPAVVSGVFRQLERELESHATQTGWLLGQSPTGGGLLLAFVVFAFLGIVSAIALFALLTLIDGAGILHIDFSPPSEKGPGLIGTLLVVGFFVGGIPLDWFLRSCFPPAQFTGQLSDAGANNRSWLIWIGGVVLLPIVLAEVHRHWAKATTK